MKFPIGNFFVTKNMEFACRRQETIQPVPWHRRTASYNWAQPPRRLSPLIR